MEPKGPGGRPSDFKEEYCQMLIEHMATGLSFESFAGLIGTCKQTLYTWTQNYPQFLDAKYKAFSECQLFWEKKGLEGLFTESEYDPQTKTNKTKAINDRIWRINMYNRFGWSDKKEITTDDKPKKLIIKMDKE
jgi:hypothetical protein